MRIIYIKATNIKSIPKNSDVLTFYKTKSSEKEPVSTIILGGNGTSKSTFLESLALLSHANILEVCNKDPRNKSDNHIEIKVSLTNKKEDVGISVFSAVKDINDGKTSKPEINIEKLAFSDKKAGFLSSHIVNEDLLKKHWCVFYLADNPARTKDFSNLYKNLLTRNRPQIPILTEVKTTNERHTLTERIKRAGVRRQSNLDRWLPEIRDTSVCHRQCKNDPLTTI